MKEEELSELSIEEIYQKVDKCQIDIGITQGILLRRFEKLEEAVWRLQHRIDLWYMDRKYESCK